MAYTYVHKTPTAGEHKMNYYDSHVYAFKARQIRLAWIKVRRQNNAIARNLGFKNYEAWGQ